MSKKKPPIPRAEQRTQLHPRVQRIGPSLATLRRGESAEFEIADAWGDTGDDIFSLVNGANHSDGRPASKAMTEPAPRWFITVRRR